MMHFRFRPRDTTHVWRYYRAPRWYDARAAATAHFPAIDELEWAQVPPTEFDQALSGPMKNWVYDVTWTGHDAGHHPTRAMHVTLLRKGAS